VRFKARAASDGGAGEVVTVRHLRSGAEYAAQVIGFKSVRVLWQPGDQPDE